MDRIRNFIKTISAKLQEKLGKIDTMFFQYFTMMSTDIHQLRIRNNNESVLANDPVYNNPETPEIIKLAIADRSLLDMSEQEFENLYKSLLYGISLQKTEPPATKEKSVGEQTMAAIDRETYLDQIPKHISSEIAILAGHTENYLLRVCRENSLTLRQLQQLLELKQDYSTNLSTILSMLAQNLSIEEAGIFLQTRENLMQTKQTFSLIQLIIFQECFSDVPIDPDILEQKIIEACDLLAEANPNYAKHYPDIKLKILMEIAYCMNASSLEVVLDWLDECSQFPVKKGPHEYPDHRHSPLVQIRLAKTIITNQNKDPENAKEEEETIPEDFVSEDYPVEEEDILEHDYDSEPEENEEEVEKADG